VSTSAYYAWLANKKERDKREQGYADIIKRIFEKSKKTMVLTASVDALEEWAIQHLISV
jgi:hypothetical protein